MLEGLRSGEAAILRDVADEDDRDPLPLCELHESESGLADLADAACRSVELVDRHRLDRVDDDERRVARSGVLGDPTDLALGDDPDSAARSAHAATPRRVEKAEARGAEPDLGARFLAGRIE